MVTSGERGGERVKIEVGGRVITGLPISICVKLLKIVKHCRIKESFIQ